MTEAEKRDFIAQITALVEEAQDILEDKGFNPADRLDGLKVKKLDADSAEIAQQEAAAKAKQTLTDAYKDASDVADLISGLLGKDNELVKKMRKFRS